MIFEKKRFVISIPYSVSQSSISFLLIKKQKDKIGCAAKLK